MVTVVYIDSVFCLNTLMDCLLLWATGQLAGISVRKGRCFAAGIFGGFYAAAVFLPGWYGLASLPGKLAAGMGMSLIAFGGERRFFRLVLLFAAVSCGMAGCVMGIGLLSGGLPMENGVFYTDIDVRVLLTAAAAAYVVLTVVFRSAAGPGVRGVLIPVTLEWGGRRVTLTALCDTGNTLRDPATGRPMLVAEAARLMPLWPPYLRPVLSPGGLHSPAAALGSLGDERKRFSLVPYRAVGVDGGLLLAVRVDRGVVSGRTFERLLIALSPTELGDGYAALWGETERGEVYEQRNCWHAEKKIGGSTGAAGCAAAAGGPLYRRQRCSAASVVQRTGGGAGSSSGGPGGPERTH